mmetsp:Transcript_25067/g.83362  ORF Transcript_25067/g.83362 Transcript_25067/m.83362 type:complete len:235 (+) Transcript_25067:199-903(+)
MLALFAEPRGLARACDRGTSRTLWCLERRPRRREQRRLAGSGKPARELRPAASHAEPCRTRDAGAARPVERLQHPRVRVELSLAPAAAPEAVRLPHPLAERGPAGLACPPRLAARRVRAALVQHKRVRRHLHPHPPRRELVVQREAVLAVADKRLVVRRQHRAVHEQVRLAHVRIGRGEGLGGTAPLLEPVTSVRGLRLLLKDSGAAAVEPVEQLALAADDFPLGCLKGGQHVA